MAGRVHGERTCILEDQLPALFIRELRGSSVREEERVDAPQMLFFLVVLLEKAFGCCEVKDGGFLCGVVVGCA
eukprot:1285060-Rhodomonas_salina.2